MHGAQVALNRALAKAGVSGEAVEAEVHRMLFSHVREKHPTRGRSFLEACDPGIFDLIDEFAGPGEEMSRLLVDAAKKGDSEVVKAMLLACANVEYGVMGKTPLYVAAAEGHVTEGARACSYFSS